MPSLLVSLYRYVASTRWPSGSPSTSTSPNTSKPRKITSTAAYSSAGRTIGRLTLSATDSGDAPEMRAASSTSEPRLRSADDTYRYTCGTCVSPAMMMMLVNEYTFHGAPPNSCLNQIV